MAVFNVLCLQSKLAESTSNKNCSADSDLLVLCFVDQVVILDYYLLLMIEIKFGLLSVINQKLLICI